MSVKAGLKAAKAALDSSDWDRAITEAQSVLESDSNNYFAKLFIGRAHEKQRKFDDAAKAYESAANSKPDDSQAWLGLCSVYEAQGSKKVDEYREAAVNVAKIFLAADDQHRCQTTIDKLVGFAKQHGTTAQYKRVLKLTLPSGPFYDFLEGRLPHPSHTYTRLVEMTEMDEARRIKSEIDVRRTRIGARVGQVTTDVRREVFHESDLEELYQEVINWSNDDEIRREYEEKLLERAYETLAVLPLDEKASKLDQVLNLAEGMVIIKHPFALAWDLVLETRDMDDLRDLDVNILREYVSYFPESGLSKVLQGWLSSELSPFPPPPKEKEDEKEASVKARSLGPEDRLLLLTEGLSGAQQSPLAYRLVSEYYLYLEEHESVLDSARSGLKTLTTESIKLGLSLQNTKDALNNALGTALVPFQAPRNHPEAKRLFEDILERKPHSTPALIGLGLIFEETENYQEAITFFTRALQEDKGNLRVGTELAWCRALCGSYTDAQKALEDYLPLLKSDDPRGRDLKAQVLYRIGVCVWESDNSKAARKDRTGAYSHFLSAIKTNVNFAPAYTSLGLYYSDYAKDKKRARQCFQKAFELSAAETGAAERLAKYFADQGDWDIVEVVAQRVVDSGRARPPPGSKRKGISWPYSALGVVQMNKQEYQKAIVSFLSALRISPDDYQSYVGLGESYHNSGRYNSALRTFTHALDPPEGVAMKTHGETWFARYMLANVHRELGDYDEAIDGLQAVLKERSTEFGVLMSLLQTFVEKAWRCADSGLFGQAITSCKYAFSTASDISKERPNAFNMWKAVGDACLVFSVIQSGIDEFPVDAVKTLLGNAADPKTYDLLGDIDRVELKDADLKHDDDEANVLLKPLATSILAYKRAIAACSNNIHAQAVAWYNLGIAEQRTYSQIGDKGGKRYLRAAVRCFKQAIELEAGNAEFWNSLGVATTTLNPKVAQHAFVRSLHLNELNAKVWANLGVLYLLQNDHELAHRAFGRAQSTDPDYAHAWVGEGLIALLTGDASLALNHFTHAFEISDASSVITHRQYALSSFDYLLNTPTASNDLTKLIEPIFALGQLRAHAPKDLPYRHLAALLLERVGDHNGAIEGLTELCASAEAEYEASETLAALARFAQAKSDLSRNQLAAGIYDSATENAELALDLSSDADSSGLDTESRRKLRLSAHLTAGLASSRLQKSIDAISMFRAALQESNNNPDVVCLLVKVLWAHGGTDETSVAREQLFECVEKHPEHVGSVTLLGAIAALDDDTDTADAVKDDLLALRTKDGLNLTEQGEIESLLSAFAALSSGGASHALEEAQAYVLLKPGHPQAWLDVAELSGEAYADAMAQKTAEQAVPPLGEMLPEDLAEASIGTIADAQRSIFLAPWKGYGWNAMADALS